MCIDYTNTYGYATEDYGNSRIRKIELSTGIVTTILTGSKVLYAFGIACDGAGGIYFTDVVYNTLYYSNYSSIVTANSAAQLVAGSASVSGHVDGIGASATFYYPHFIAMDPNNTFVFISDYNSNLIRRMVASRPYYVTTIGSLGHVWSIDSHICRL